MVNVIDDEFGMRGLENSLSKPLLNIAEVFGLGRLGENQAHSHDQQ